MTISNMLKQTIDCLIKINAYHKIVHHCQPSIELIIMPENVFSEENYRLINSLYHAVDNEKKAFIQEQLLPEQKLSFLDDSSDVYESSSNISLLFRRHNSRESFNKIRPSLNQSAANLYFLLNSICSMASAITLTSSHDIFLERLKIITYSFADLLNDLSDYIEQLPFAVRSSAFSLGRYLEKLEQNYETQYEYFYRPSGMLSWFNLYYLIKKSLRNEDRLQEINFIMRLSLHEHSTDELRRSVIEIINRKISEKEPSRNSNRSILKTILDAGILRSSCLYNANCFEIVCNFCHKYSLDIPNHLSDYIRDKIITRGFFY